MEIPKIAVIIPTHNSDLTIERCLHSLVSQTYPREKFEIIVVDDGSTDNSIEKAKKAGADQVIATEHSGANVARTIGIKQSKGKFIACIDSDCEATDGWLKTIENELGKNKAITGPIENGIENPISWAEYFLEFSEFNEYKSRSKVRFLPGCNQAFLRDSYDATRGFPNVPSSQDVMFGESLRRAGVVCYFIPELKIQHLGLADLKKFSAKFKIRGAGYLRSIKDIEDAPHNFLSKTRWFIPLFFFGMVFSRLRYAIKAKRLGKFLISFPTIILGITSFCKGVWKEFGK